MKRTKKIMTAILLAGTVFLLAGCTYDRAALNGTESAAAVEAPAPDEMMPAAAPAASTNMSMEDAKALALSTAGLKESDVTFTETSFEYDDGMNLWQIGFVSGTTEYEYDINDDTKQVVGYDVESIYD